MKINFDAGLDGAFIDCWLTPDQDLTGAVYCFSIMAPALVIHGGELVKSVGGYCEIALPDIAANQRHGLRLRHVLERHIPTNRAWLPLGGYVRHEGELIELPVLPAGVHTDGTFSSSTSDGLRLLPTPTIWQADTGTTPAPGFATQDRFENIDALAIRAGLPAFEDRSGIPVAVVQNTRLSPEAYRITISPGDVVIEAADKRGEHHAAISLLILRQTHEGELPCGTIEDAPRFEWRGQHLDCARHFFEVDTILKLLDYMALVKMNRFHWHFADDEAFRLQVDCLPELWQKSEFRGEGCMLPGIFGGGIRSGGSYSKADVQKILDRAAELHIDVMPELEIPAHALCFNQAIRGLRDQGDTGTEMSVQGYYENVVNPALASTWEVLNALVDEVGAMFPFQHLHLGCDELPPETWASSPAVDRLKAENGLETTDDVQGWTMAKIARRVVANGQRPAAWEEAARGGNGGIGNGAILFSWTEQGPGIEAARAGYDVVMCPAQNAYLDMAHTRNPDDWGASWAGVIPLEDTIDWQVVPEGCEDISERVIGVEGTFWGEFTTKDREMHAMLAPRMLGVAEKAWGQEGSVDVTEFRSQVRYFGPIFDAMGWDWNRGA